MRGTSNTGAGKVTGDAFASATANDLLKIAVEADDNILAELLAFDPPAGVTSMTPRVGFLPLGNGPVVTGDGAARNVTVVPIRAIRSSIDNTKPREALSAVVGTSTTVAMPAVVGAGLWRLELLYAQIAYVNSSKPEQGTTCTLAFAPTAAGAAVAGAPTVATLPANTSTTWNVPIAYVKNVGGAVSIANEDILPAPASVVSGFAQDLQARLVAQKTGIDARRAYSSANNDPTKLVSGGTSAFAAFADTRLTSTNTPISIGRPNVEFVMREILIPKDITGGNASTPTDVIVDDTRDWRGANFYSLWTVAEANGASYYFGEDDAGFGASRVFPSNSCAGALIDATHFVSGNSHVARSSNIGTAPDFTVAELETNTQINSGVDYYTIGTDFVGLTVDSATGVLRFSSSIAGAIAGAPISCLLVAVFGNHNA